MDILTGFYISAFFFAILALAAVLTTIFNLSTIMRLKKELDVVKAQNGVYQNLTLSLISGCRHGTATVKTSRETTVRGKIRDICLVTDRFVNSKGFETPSAIISISVTEESTCEGPYVERRTRLEAYAFPVSSITMSNGIICADNGENEFTLTPPAPKP